MMSTRSTGVKKSSSLNIADSPPQFAMISKNDLKIDDAYQRKLKEKSTKKYAADWSWVACGALKVALRADGEWFVFDGQHRRDAAMLRPDIDLLPCLIYEVENIQAEAKGFLTQATQRPMTSVDRFNAQVIAGNPEALIAKQITDSLGVAVRAGVKPGHSGFAAINELLKCIKEDEAAVRRIFPLLFEYIVHQRGTLTERLLRGSFHIERVLSLSGGSLTDPVRRRQLMSTPWSRMSVALGNISSGGSPGPSTIARAFLESLNFGRRSKLIVKGLNDV